MGFPSVSIPIPTGDGLTKDSAYFFTQAQGNFDAIGMAYKFMQSRGPQYRRLRQYLYETTDSEIIEWWETPSGKFWFRYQLTP
jgi:hypothetical protein